MPIPFFKSVSHGPGTTNTSQSGQGEHPLHFMEAGYGFRGKKWHLPLLRKAIYATVRPFLLQQLPSTGKQIADSSDAFLAFFSLFSSTPFKTEQTILTNLWMHEEAVVGTKPAIWGAQFRARHNEYCMCGKSQLSIWGWEPYSNYLIQRRKYAVGFYGSRLHGQILMDFCE